jgi:hypothetical protein
MARLPLLRPCVTEKSRRVCRCSSCRGSRIPACSWLPLIVRDPSPPKQREYYTGDAISGVASILPVSTSQYVGYRQEGNGRSIAAEQRYHDLTVRVNNKCWFTNSGEIGGLLLQVERYAFGTQAEVEPRVC